MDTVPFSEDVLKLRISRTRLFEDILELLRDVDLEHCSIKSLRQTLEDEFRADLSAYRDLIETTAMDVLASSHPTGDDHGMQEKAEEEDRRLAEEMQLQENTRGRRATRTSRLAGKKEHVKREVGKDGTAGKKRPTFNRPLILSDALSQLCDGAKALPRPEVVRMLWAYVKRHELQDPADKRFIRCDERLQEIFRVKRINCFRMNQQLSRHLMRPEDISPDEQLKASEGDTDALLKMPDELGAILGNHATFVDAQQRLLAYIARHYGRARSITLKADDPLVVNGELEVDVLRLMQRLSESIDCLNT